MTQTFCTEKVWPGEREGMQNIFRLYRSLLYNRDEGNKYLVFLKQLILQKV